MSTMYGLIFKIQRKMLADPFIILINDLRQLVFTLFLTYFPEFKPKFPRLSFCCLPGRANHWSALIGASHSRGYVLWEYGGYASEGVRQVAEFGSPIKMEEEIRQKVGSTSDGGCWFSVTPFLMYRHYFHSFPLVFCSSCRAEAKWQWLKMGCIKRQMK